MKIDVFVSYHAASAQNIAEAVVNKLEQQGLRCWYQDRDTGGYFADVIKRAIDECGVFVVLLNQGACRSRHIRSEVSLAYDRDEVEILPLRLENVKLSDALDYYLHGIHWIDAVNRSLDAALDDLSKRTLKALNKAAPGSKIETIKYDDGSVYTGEVVDGKRHGKGKFVWGKDSSWAGDIYEGDFVDDKRHGNGKYTWHNGDVYEGDFVDDRRHGSGKMTWSSGSIYEGEWCNDKRHGKGKYIWPSSSCYEGDFSNGVRNGKGKLTWASGSCYEGDFVNGVRTGKGTIVWGRGKKRAGDTYKGDFVNGVRTGIGTYTYADGRVLSGTFLNGVFQD